MSALTIYIIQSAHTDIGYTHPQEQMARMYLDHYDRVLDLCQRTANKPASERFKWTCETFWQVENYIKNRPERLEKFLGFVRSGQIEITASYLHFTDMIDADAYRQSIRLAVDFCQKHNLPLQTAMHCDINGWGWSVADILAENNIPYFCSQIHIDNATDPLGKRGSVHYHWTVESDYIRSDAPIRVPQGFWWVGPNNGRVLHWLNEHYLLGNVLGISSPKPFGTDKTQYFYETDHLNSGDLYDIAQHELPRYVDRVREAGYTHNVMLLSTGGYYIDNSRPDDRWLEVIAKWNAEHDNIHLRTATLSEWFEALNNVDTTAFPSYHVAWPDHWAHGLGSSTAQVAQARRTQRRREDVKSLVASSGSAVAREFLAQSQRQEWTSLEHTFGAWSTSQRPEAAANQFQQMAKDITFHRAELYLDEAVGTALRSHEVFDKVSGDQAALVIPNRETSKHLVNFDAGDHDIDPQKHVLTDEANNSYPLQYDNDRTRQFVASLPIAQQDTPLFFLVESPAKTPSEDNDPRTEIGLSNDFWTIEIDPTTGGLKQLEEKSQSHNWADTAHAQSFGQVIREQVIHPLKHHAAGNLARLIALGSASEEAHQLMGDSPIFERHMATFKPEIHRESGPVFDSLMVEGEANQSGRLNMTWRLYHQLPVVELVINWYKTWSDLPEAAYVAFPFAVSDARLELETAGGFFEPGSHDENGQLPGTSSSFYTIQRAARMTDNDRKLLWLPLDAPLVMANETNYNRWEIDPWSWNGLLASMPVNHYWHTNFPMSQQGYLRLRYRLVNPALFADTETAIQSALPLDAFGWV